jgi:uncharacterized protein YkwD
MKKIILFATILFLALVFVQSEIFAQESTTSPCNSVISCFKVLNSNILTSILTETNKNLTTPEPTTTKDYETQVAEEIHRLINIERNSNGLDSLSFNSLLSNAAKLHSQDMAEKGYFSHTSADGRSLKQRIEAQGVNCNSWGENIFQNNHGSIESVARTTVEGWMNSPGHKTNILGRYNTEGIGVAIATNGKIYITQDFC